MAITTRIDTKGTRKEKKTMEKLTDGLKKILLAGIGTVAVTAEKSKDVLDDLVKKGELTVEQGKALNEELKHNIKQTVKDKVNVSVKTSTPEELNDDTYIITDSVRKITELAVKKTGLSSVCTT